MHQQDKKPNRPAMPGRRKEVTEKQNRKVVAWQRRCACSECDGAEWEDCTEQEYQAALEDPEMQTRQLCVCGPATFDPIAMLDLRVKAREASPWGTNSERTNGFVKGALWHAQSVAQTTPEVPECSLGYGHPGIWCGPNTNCWLDPRSPEDRAAQRAPARLDGRGHNESKRPDAAQPAPVVPEECPHLILFDGAEMKPIMFAGTGARRGALAKWEQVSKNWNAHLFVRIEKNSRDDRYPCAMFAAAAPAQGQQVEWRTTAVMLEQANAGLAQLNGKLRAELSALKAHPEAYQFDGQVLRDEHGNYLAEFMAYEQSFIDRLLHPQPELKAQQVGQEPAGEVHLRTGGGISLLHVELAQPLPPGTKLYTAPQPAPAQDVAGLVEAASGALAEIQAVMQEAYNSAAPVCCGRGISECCGSPDPEWSEHDQRTMDRFAPHELALRAALADLDKQSGEVK